MHFGDCLAMCGLEVAKWRASDLGEGIYPEAALMIKKSYVCESIGGRDELTVGRLI